MERGEVAKNGKDISPFDDGADYRENSLVAPDRLDGGCRASCRTE